MPTFNMRDETRKQYTATLAESGFSCEQLQTGALLRIADAAEKMAVNVTRLQSDLKLMEESRDMWKRQAERIALSKRALQGVITKLKQAKAAASTSN